jgi:1,4-dihydroxy-2-naphthoyl-CoA synthase
MGKQMFYKQLEMGLDAAYQLASETMACNAMCEDAAEGIDAFIAKRKPGCRAACWSAIACSTWHGSAFL